MIHSGDSTSFEQWVSKEIGEETLNELKSNYYINYGPTKYMFEYIFNNIYNPKFIKLVKYNLNLKQADDKEFVKNEKLTQLKLKNIKMKEKLHKIKSLYDQEEQEIERLYASFNTDNQLKSSIDSDLIPDLVNYQVDKSFVKRIEHYKEKFEKATKILTDLFSRNQGGSLSCTNYSMTQNYSIKRNGSDSMNLKKLGKKDLNSWEKDYLVLYQALVFKYKKELERNSPCFQVDNSFSKDSAVSSDHLSMLEYLDINEHLNCLNHNLTLDQDNFSRIRERNAIRNEIKLIKYQGDLRMTKNYEHDSVVKSRPEYMEFINYYCQMDYLNNCITKMLPELDTNKQNLHNYLKYTYKSSDLAVLVKYLKFYFKLKNAETSRSELGSYLAKLESEIELGKAKFLSIKNKIHKLEIVDASIVTIYANLLYLSKKNKSLAESVDIKSDSFSLSDLNKQNSCILRSIQTLIQNGYQFEIRPKRINCKLKLTANKSNPIGDKSCLINDILKYRNYESQSFVFSKFNKLSSFLNILLKRLDKKISMIYMQNSKSLKETIATVKSVSRKCQRIDQEELAKFLYLIDKQLEKCVVTKDSLEFQTKQVDIWWRQPGAYECKFENLTLNNKSLSYFIELIDNVNLRFNSKNNVLSF